MLILSLQLLIFCGKILSVMGRLAQLVEHSLDVRRVSGSSPLTSTIYDYLVKLPYVVVWKLCFIFRRDV